MDSRRRGPRSARADGAVQAGRIYQDIYHKRSDASPALGEASLARARIVGGELAFDGAQARGQAFEDGVFLLEIPTELDLSAADRFAQQFFQGPLAPPYGRFRDMGPDCFNDALLGFHQRSNQIEQFLLERRFWARRYPPEIATLGEALTRISARVLHGVLQYIGLPRELWNLATGGCGDQNGAYHLTFNHYRPQLGGVGLASHKDDGFVTILRTTQAGLEVNRKDRWERVFAGPDHFVVNFGLSMEMLTACCKTPVSAILHRVAHQDFDRHSYGHFASSDCKPGADGGVFRYVPGIGLERICSSRELIDANDLEIYTGTKRPEDAQL